MIGYLLEGVNEMKKTMLSKHGFSLALIIMLLGSFFIVSSCRGGGGGGGGGGAGSAGISYNGVTTQASITVANANKIFSVIWNGGSSSVSASLSPAISKAASSEYSKNDGMVTLFKRLKDRSLSDFTGFATQSKNIIRATAVNETHYGSVSGTLTITGSIDPNTMTGSLTMTYVNFNDGDGYTYDGTVTVSVTGFDMTYGIITDATMNFTLWTIKSANSNVSLSGSIRVQESLQNNSDTLTVNMDGRDNLTNDTYRYENFVVIYVYNNVLYPSSGSETESGRVYIGPYGYVDVTTTIPFTYTTNSQENPNSGGPIILSGAGNSKAAITPISASYVKIEVDADGDGVFESNNAYSWSNLEGASIKVATFGSAIDFVVGSLPTFAVVADFNGDGKSDLAVANNNSDNVSILLGNGTGSFGAATNFAVGTYPTSVAVGDFNGDGKLDLVVTNFGSDNVSILLGNGDGTFGAATNYALAVEMNPTSVVVGDFNGDGKLDLAVTLSFGFSNTTPGFVSILLGTGTGLFGAAANYAVGGAPRSVAAGDFNGDGNLDLTVANSLSDNISILLGNVDGTFGAATNFAMTVGEYPTSVVVGDFNGDGKLDLAVTDNSYLVNNSNVSILLGTGTGSFGAPTRFFVDPVMGSYLNSAAVGDFNGDGKLDLAVAKERTGTPGSTDNVSILLGDGTGFFWTGISFVSLGNTPTSVAVGDFSGDGKPDLAVVTSDISVFLNITH